MVIGSCFDAEQNTILISDAMAVIRTAAENGSILPQDLWDFADELIAFAMSQPGFVAVWDADPLLSE